MKYIAFRRAKHCPAVSHNLHPEFIVEYADTSLFPPGFHRLEDGWESLLEKDFENELLQNDKLHSQFLITKRQREIAYMRAKAIAVQQENKEQLKMQKEFEEFRAWKASKGK